MSLLASFKPSNVERKVEPFTYQTTFHDKVQAAWAEGFNRVLAVLPTGGGKSIAAGELIAREVEGGRRVLVMAHTRKLVKQFAGVLRDAFGIWAEVEAGADEADREAPVIVSTIQTMTNRINKEEFKPNEFSLIVLDEAHRALAPSYKKAATYFDQSTKYLGITATPRRGDQRDILKFFDTKAIDVPLNQLINEGYLAPLIIRNIPVRIDMTQIRVKHGDYQEADIAHAIEPYLESCADGLVEHGHDRKSLVFLPLIDTSKKFTRLLNDRGFAAAHVDGTMKEDDVSDLISQLTEGKIKAICNSMLLTEGVDIPPVDLILNLRLTRSWTLYMQICGRGTRTYPGKENCILLDPLWLCDMHNLLQRPATLIAHDDDEAEQIERKIEEGAEDLIEAQRQVMFDREQKLQERLAEMARRKARQIDAMELFLSMGMVDMAEYEPMARWEMERITDGQRSMLAGSGIDLDSVRDRGHATAIIGAIIGRAKQGLATVRMAKYAQSLGMQGAFLAPFAQVSQFIEIAKHNKSVMDAIPD